MKNRFILCLTMLCVAVTARGESTNAATWHFKEEFLPTLVKAVPKILKTEQGASGRFGSGIWISSDQMMIFPLAAAWAFQDAKNPYYHDPKLLEVIMRGGDVLSQTQDKRGQWMFRKKDNSTWGPHFNPWVYSRWVRAFSLIENAMPPARRAVWVKGLELGFSGIEKNELTRVVNIPTHQAMGLYIAGQVLHHPEWCTKASAFLDQVAAAQDENGFWTEHVGPVVHYNVVYVDALGTYYSVSHDEKVRLALERAVRFHTHFTYPDGTQVETIDERNPYLKSFHLPNPGFTFTAEGRGYLREQWTRLQSRDVMEVADIVASLLWYGEEGPAVGSSRDSIFVTADGNGSVVRNGDWCVSASAYTAAISGSRWIQDRQNFVSLFHERTGLILGGGNTKLQPLWSTFTVGDVGLLKHRAGDENPNFAEPKGLLHIPTKARLDTNGLGVILEYGATVCGVTLDLVSTNEAQLTYAVKSRANNLPVEAHVTFLPVPGKPWRTASGKGGDIGPNSFKMTAREIGGWFEHNGWRVELPENSTIRWPVLPHNPYRKDGQAVPAEGRIVLTLPFSATVATQKVEVRIGQ